VLAPCILFIVVCVAGLVTSEGLGRRAGVYVFKPLASTGFLALAMLSGAAHSGYGRLILAGLALSWLGDVLLMARDRPQIFQAGIASFLLGHVVYVVAFAGRGFSLTWAAFAAILVVVAALIAIRWLRPHVTDDFRVAVHAYVIVISTMVVFALGSFPATQDVLIPVGALLFYASDLSVARDRFIKPAFVNGAWGLPAYYGGQILLALSVAGTSGGGGQSQ